MGTYLSKPNLQKNIDSGDDLSCFTVPLNWACVDMQGWRKSMEDAHVANTSVKSPSHVQYQFQNKAKYFADQNELSEPPIDVEIKSESNAKVFAVFDGHGGAEVAKFCEKHLVNVLVKQKEWKEGNVGKALTDAFHELDRMIDHPGRKAELIKLKMERLGTPGNTNATDISSVLTTATQALNAVSPAENLSNVRLTEFGDDEPSEIDVVGEAESVSSTAGTGKPAVQRRGQKDKMPSNVQKQSSTEKAESDSNNDESTSLVKFADDALSNESECDASETTDQNNAMPLDDTEEKNLEVNSIDNEKIESEQAHNIDKEDPIKEVESILPDENPINDNIEEQKPSNAMLLIQELFAVSQVEAEKKRLAPSGIIDEKEDIDCYKNCGEDDNCQGNVSSMTTTRNPTRIQNGRPVCNLTDHPIHAGCTSVVVVITDSILTVANAGDSRAVLCRKGGLTEPLSLDHKPMQQGELARITKAGGFVNQFGRVNGNLNLSRSIGDLKYKQIEGLAPSEQMITAEPDITQVKLESGDEFIIIGCDGIWDCLTNEEAVKFVRDRIDTKTPSEIGVEMLDAIVSPDPKASQGIGGDNMTCLIVDLLPHSREYCGKSKSESGEEQMNGENNELPEMCDVHAADGEGQMDVEELCY